MGQQRHKEGHRLVVPDQPGDAHRAVVLGPLSAFNAEHGYPVDSRPLAVLLEDEAGKAVGGLWGRTGYGWLFVELLAVPAALRGHGFGCALIREAERVAADRGCVGAWLTTFTFQAQGFYEALGYEVFARLEDSPPGSARIFLRRHWHRDRAGGGSS